MTDDEWQGISYVMDECWAGDLTDEKAGAYRLMLDRYEPTAIMAALHKLTHNPNPHLPTVPQIVSAIDDLRDPEVPSWPEVWEVMSKNLVVSDEKRCFSRLSAFYPPLAVFVRREGLEKLAHTPFYDDQYGELRIKDLKARWEEFMEVARERMKRGLALEAVGRAELGPSPMAAVLERVVKTPKELESGP